MSRLSEFSREELRTLNYYLNLGNSTLFGMTGEFHAKTMLCEVKEELAARPEEPETVYPEGFLYERTNELSKRLTALRGMGTGPYGQFTAEERKALQANYAKATAEPKRLFMRDETVGA
jgi:hypothetical protein